MFISLPIAVLTSVAAICSGWKGQEIKVSGDITPPSQARWTDSFLNKFCRKQWARLQPRSRGWVHLAKSWCLQHRYQPLSWVKRLTLNRQDSLSWGGHPDQDRLTPEIHVSLSWLRRKSRHNIPTETSTTKMPKDRRGECSQVLFRYGVNAPANLEYYHLSQLYQKMEQLRSIPRFLLLKYK